MAEISHTHTINTVDSLTINIPQNARNNEDITITFSQILALLPHCPTLRDLTISDMVFESNSEFTQLPDNLKVEKLMILSLYDHNMIDHIRECIGYLVVNLRRLSGFVTTVDAHQYLNDLVEREKSEYPHLVDLDMSGSNMFL
ncbi:hypothetical protein FB645_001501 [Coemansia sp. IMI 203386]|nr:hypothetical protein FB645_001501 [Coemansia sp. IMI 203386]